MCLAAGGEWDPDLRNHTQDGDRGADVLPLEEKIRRIGCRRAEASQVVGGGESGAEVAGGGFESGQEDASGCSGKKALTPGRKRDWVEVLQVRYNVSLRRSCEAIQLARSKRYYCSVADDQAFLRMRIKGVGSGMHRLGLPADPYPA